MHLVRSNTVGACVRPGWDQRSGEKRVVKRVEKAKREEWNGGAEAMPVVRCEGWNELLTLRSPQVVPMRAQFPSPFLALCNSPILRYPRRTTPLVKKIQRTKDGTKEQSADAPAYASRNPSVQRTPLRSEVVKRAEKMHCEGWDLRRCGGNAIQRSEPFGLYIFFAPFSLQSTTISFLSETVGHPRFVLLAKHHHFISSMHPRMGPPQVHWSHPGMHRRSETVWCASKK